MSLIDYVLSYYNSNFFNIFTSSNNIVVENFIEQKKFPTFPDLSNQKAYKINFTYAALYNTIYNFSEYKYLGSYECITRNAFFIDDLYNIIDFNQGI
jgi:hypothetical protein